MEGHDIDYVGISGALSHRPAEPPPTPPLALVGDCARGSMLLAMGVVAALFERCASGRGQVVDAAIIDGVLSPSTIFFAGMLANRGREHPDGGSRFYEMCTSPRTVAAWR